MSAPLVRCEVCSLYWPDYATMTKPVDGNQYRSSHFMVLCDHCLQAADPKWYAKMRAVRNERLRQREELYTAFYSHDR